MDWEAANISRRGTRLYAVMTVPKEARAAMGGQTQVRLSAGTNDPDIAKKRLHDLETKLRKKVLAAVEAGELSNPDREYQQAVTFLRLEDRPYHYEYDPKIDDVLPRAMRESPIDNGQLKDAERLLSQRLLDLKQAYLQQDPTTLLKLLEDFGGTLPDAVEAEQLVASAIAQVKRALNVDEDTAPTLLSFLPVFEHHNAQRVEQRAMKLKSAKARARNIRSFIEQVGDHPLHGLGPRNAYAYAEALSDGHGNSTIKTRISDVSTLLDYALSKGVIEKNPFIGLKLSRYGKKTENYPPLSEEQLHTIFAIPGLPDYVRALWAILIATGMRLDEVATLRVEQVKRADGILHFDLQSARVKNRSSQRRIPVAAILEPLIHKLVADTLGSEQLFPFRVNSDGKTRASSVCGYWIKKANMNPRTGTTAARYTTHSLRGTFKDKMRDAGVPLEVHNALLGHDLHTVSASYGRGPGLPILKDAVDRASHPYLSWIAEFDTCTKHS